MKHIVLPFSFILILILCSLSFAQSDNSGTYSALFLRADLSPRVSGLGGSFVALADDENSLLYNPAGLANLRLSSAAFNHTSWIEDISFENLLASYKINSNFGVGLGVSFLSIPSIQGRAADGTATEKLDVTSNVIALGVGYKIRPGYNVGLGIKYFNEDLAGFSGSGVAFDFGYYMKTWLSGLYFGLAAQNIGGKIKYNVGEEEIPLVIRTGVAYKMPMRKLNFLLDVVKAADQDIQFNFGSEWSFENYFTLRIGNQTSSEKVFAPTFGFGLNYGEGYLIDYTFDNNLDLGTTHRAGITFKFDITGSSKITPVAVYTVNSPSGLNYEIHDEKLIVNWNMVPDANYNVYVKMNSTESWKKIKDELSNTALELKRPAKNTKYYLTVTAVKNGRESSFGKEIEIISK